MVSSVINGHYHHLCSPGCRYLHQLYWNHWYINYINYEVIILYYDDILLYDNITIVMSVLLAVDVYSSSTGITRHISQLSTVL